MDGERCLAPDEPEIVADLGQSARVGRIARNGHFAALLPPHGVKGNEAVPAAVVVDEQVTVLGDVVTRQPHVRLDVENLDPRAAGAVLGRAEESRGELRAELLARTDATEREQDPAIAAPEAVQMEPVVARRAFARVAEILDRLRPRQRPPAEAELPQQAAVLPERPVVEERSVPADEQEPVDSRRGSPDPSLFGEDVVDVGHQLVRELGDEAPRSVEHEQPLGVGNHEPVAVDGDAARTSRSAPWIGIRLAERALRRRRDERQAALLEIEDTQTAADLRRSRVTDDRGDRDPPLGEPFWALPHRGRGYRPDSGANRRSTSSSSGVPTSSGACRASPRRERAS